MSVSGIEMEVKMTEPYVVILSGCDDETRAAVELTQEQAEFLRLFAERISAVSTYGCMPTMSVTRLEDTDEWEREDLGTIDLAEGLRPRPEE